MVHKFWLRPNAVAIAFGLVLGVAHADGSTQEGEDSAPFYSPQSLWLNPGDFSYHFDRHIQYRGDNWGFGAQIDFPHDVALLGGSFINSDNQHSYDAGILWQPLHLGPIKIGGVAGAFNGYPHYLNGGWFPALLPMVSTSIGRIGVNLTVIPNYKDRLHGAFVAQFIVKVW